MKLRALFITNAVVSIPSGVGSALVRSHRACAKRSARPLRGSGRYVGVCAELRRPGARHNLAPAGRRVGQCALYRIHKVSHLLTKFDTNS
jgi:hypothetical protein